MVRGVSWGFQRGDWISTAFPLPSTARLMLAFSNNSLLGRTLPLRFPSSNFDRS